MRHLPLYIILMSLCAPAVSFADSYTIKEGKYYRIDEGEMISGPITKFKRESVYIQSRGDEIEVKLDKVDMKVDLKKVLKPGDILTAYGHFGRDDDEMEANRISFQHGNKVISLHRDHVLHSNSLKRELIRRVTD